MIIFQIIYSEGWASLRSTWARSAAPVVGGADEGRRRAAGT
jgi:hypothetical protein